MTAKVDQLLETIQFTEDLCKGVGVTLSVPAIAQATPSASTSRNASVVPSGNSTGFSPTTPTDSKSTPGFTGTASRAHNNYMGFGMSLALIAAMYAM